MGLVAWWVPAGAWLERVSFDLPTIFRDDGSFPEVVLVEMDEPSHRELGQVWGRPWSRALHARLLDHLRADGAAVVVFDVAFLDPGLDPAADAQLAAAMRAHGRVVLGAELVWVQKPGIAGKTPAPILESFRSAATNWGVVDLDLEPDEVVRRHFAGLELKPSLAWVTAAVAGAFVTRSGAGHQLPRWLCYYGPGGTLPRVSYFEATNQAPGFFRGRTVFIGGRPNSAFVGQQTDRFLTPWQRTANPHMSGMELQATAFLNLLRGDWITRLPRLLEPPLVVLLGVLLGGALALVPPRKGLVLGTLAAVALMAAACGLFWTQHLWMNWAVPVLVQVPAALGIALFGHVRELEREKEWLEAPLEGAGLEPLSSAPASPGDPIGKGFPTPEPAVESAPAVPDHELLRPIGRGGYGEVWLARDVLGQYHAVKIVRRRSFPDDGPYQREFRGLRNFTPISRAHPGLVNILHAGLNERAGYFYYVMEAGDDEVTGQQITPETYVPRTLGRDLRERGRLTRKACTELGLALTSALGFLHAQNLVHRDIKPSNIIFVHGQPKLADVGLVTAVGLRPRDHSYVGTEGYLPPEGPGTAAGDVYALGKVLEEAIGEREPAEASLLETIIRTACERDPAQRYASAEAMHHALLSLAG